jgi:alpha-tubulin suppressor-like RCC1 family protein
VLRRFTGVSLVSLAAVVALAGCSGQDVKATASGSSTSLAASSPARPTAGPGRIVTSYGPTNVTDATLVAVTSDHLFWVDASGKPQQSTLSPSEPVTPQGIPGAGATGPIVSLTASNVDSAWVAAAVDSMGTVWEWGRAKGVGLDDASFADKSYTFPGGVPVTQVPNAAQVVTAGDATFALTADGEVYSWGDTTANEILGRSAEPGQMVGPAKIPGLTGVKQIAVGGTVGFALLNDGTVWGWGSNKYATLAPGDASAWPVPQRIPQLTGITSIAVSGFHVVATTSSGEVVNWGDGTSGALGDASIDKAGVDTPVKVPGISNVAHVVADGVSIALSTDGKATAWGEHGIPDGKGATLTNDTGKPVVLQWLNGQVSAVAAGGGPESRTAFIVVG